MTFRLGLTGSIGMGKSTTAKMFGDLGCAIWDADAAVHRMYSKGGSAVEPMGAAFPTAVLDGAVSRDQLKTILQSNPSALRQIEGIVHPLVRQDRANALAAIDADIMVFDIPLLFETGGDAEMDAVACVSVSPELQEKRVMARGSMTKEQFEMILSKQMPIEQKRLRADYVIETDTMDHAKQQVTKIVADIRETLANA